MQRRDTFQDTLLILGLLCVSGFTAALTILTWRHGVAHFGTRATLVMFLPTPVPSAWLALPIHAARVAGDLAPLLSVLGIGGGLGLLAAVTNDLRPEKLLRLMRPAARTVPTPASAGAIEAFRGIEAGDPMGNDTARSP